jgi:hypothetical protein
MFEIKAVYFSAICEDGWRSDWIGAIDEVRIYDRAVSETEILKLATK